MKRYNKYKPSGIPWVGEIPAHWETRRLRAFLTPFSEKGHGDEQLLSVTRERGVIVRDRQGTDDNHNYIPDDLSGYKHVEQGDFVINKMKAWQGSYGVSAEEGIVSPAYYTCKLHGIHREYFSRAIRSQAYVGFFASHSKGIRVGQWDLDAQAMKTIPFLVPPTEEQGRIVEWIESKTLSIDTYVRERERVTVA